MIEAAISVSELFSRTFALMRAQPGKVIFAAGLTSALAIVLDQQPNADLLFLLPFLASIYFQYDLTSGALQNLGLLPGGYRTRRLGALLGLILLTQFAITLGFLLLVVPGLILLVRWFLCVPVLVTEEAGVIKSLQISWEESSWPLLAALRRRGGDLRPRLPRQLRAGLHRHGDRQCRHRLRGRQHRHLCGAGRRLARRGRRLFDAAWRHGRSVRSVRLTGVRVPPVPDAQGT